MNTFKLIIAILLLGALQTQAQNTGVNTKVANSTLTVNGSYAGAYKTINADAILDMTNQFVNVTGTTAAITLTLPDAIVANTATDAFFGRIYQLKNTSAYDVTVKASASQLIQTGPGTTANTLLLKSGQSAIVVKNANNTAGQALWDVFVQTSVGNSSSSGNGFPIGVIKAFQVNLPSSSNFTSSGGGASKNVMTDKVSASVSTTQKSVYELAGVQQSNFIVINGLRMDFLSNGDNLKVQPKFFNTTGSSITYTIATLSSGYNAASSSRDNYNNGANTVIKTNCYSYYLEEDNVMFLTNFSTDNTGYINSMLSFPNGECYNCTWHATRDSTGSFHFYFTIQRLY